MATDKANERLRLFEAAVDLAPQARSRFLDGACGSDTALRTEVEALLDEYE